MQRKGLQCRHQCCGKAVMQQTAVLPKCHFLQCRPQCLWEGPAMAAGPGCFGGDAADCCSAQCHLLQRLHQHLWEGPAMAAGLGCLTVMQQTAVLPDVISCSAAISACGKCQQWQQALGVLAVTQQTAVLPNVTSCSAAISARGKG